jgi:type VI protein secretion system component VasK
VAWFWWLLGVFIVALWIFTIVDIIRRRHTRPGSTTAAWILLVLIIPVVGTVIYFLVNGAPGGARPVDVDHTTGRRS